MILVSVMYPNKPGVRFDHGAFMAANAFFEHLGLVGGFLLVAWHDLKHAVASKDEISLVSHVPT